MELNQEFLQKFQREIFVPDVDRPDRAAISRYFYESAQGVDAGQSFLSPLDEILKRTMDVILSFALGILSLPILLITALMIKLDSPGPIFYRQERIGRDGRRINIIKFRSMQMNADAALKEYLRKNPIAQMEWNAIQKLSNDPRITRVGKWIRKYSLDELPQLYNVLKGDMSLVGPRPIVDNEVQRYKGSFDAYCAVRPGITGMWQVSGRSQTTYEQRVSFDVYYAQNWSVWLDVNILFRTIWVVVSGDGT